MGRKLSSSQITCFTPCADFFAVSCADGTFKIWNTSNGNLLAEWKFPDGDPSSYSFIACSFVGKKRKIGSATCILAVGTKDGDIFAIDAVTGVTKWKSSGHHSGGVAGLTFSKKGHSLYTVGTDGSASEIASDSGELIMEFRASKNLVSSLAFSGDQKTLAVLSSKLSVLSLETGKVLKKFPADMGPMKYISVSNDAKTVITSGFGEKNLQLWKCKPGSKSMIRSFVLSMQDPPIAFECHNTNEENEEDGVTVLAISESGVVYTWELNSVLQAEVNPIKITVIGNKIEAQIQNGENTEKNCTPIFAAKLQALENGGKCAALIAYGSIDSPQFGRANISDARVKNVQENGGVAEKDLHTSELAVTPLAEDKKKKKKRAASDMSPATPKDLVNSEHGEAMDGVLVEDDVNEPTMGEKLASLQLQDNNKSDDQEKQESSPRANAKPPSADSVDILLKQALHADDRALLLDCLYTQDEKVIANSIALLNPADVLKLLHSLVSMIQSRGAILACTLPWLRSLLLQHASGLMSQGSSLLSLNSLYQLIDSRVSTFQTTLQLSNCLDVLYAEVSDDDEPMVKPIIYEVRNDSDEEESEDAMDTDEDIKEEPSDDDDQDDKLGILVEMDDMSD